MIMKGTVRVLFVSTEAGVPCTETPPTAHALLMFSIVSLIVVASFK